MKSKKGQENARRIINYYTANKNNKSLTFEHFLAEGLSKSTISDVIKRFTEEGRVEYNMKSGPKPTKLTTRKLKKIKNTFIKNPSISVRNAAKECKISPTSLHNTKVKLKIKTRKKIVAPKQTEDQQNRCKTNAWKLYNRIISTNPNKLKNNEIDYVSKSDNLPNCPQLRPIERYWAMCKNKYRQLPDESKDLATFKRRWNKISKEISRNSGLNLFNNFKSRLSKVGKFGVNSIL